MKPLKFIYALLITHYALFSFGQENSYNLIPFPAQFNGLAGQFTLSKATKIVINPKDAGQAQAAQVLINQINMASGLGIFTANASAGSTGKHVFFQVHKQQKCGPEGYMLRVSPERILIEAETPKGYFYGVQTLLQLLPTAIFSKKVIPNYPWNVPACDILDRPRFGYRGFMLDVSRNFMPTPMIKRFIDLLALQKMNTFHWHLTDDQGWRIEIKKYPKLTQIGSKRKQTLVGHYGENYPQQYDGREYGGFYRQDEIKDVVKYAATKHITVIPEIEMPGHAMAALAAYPEFSCDPTKKYEVQGLWGVHKDVFCPSDKTFKFLEDVLTEVFALFPSKYIHIGGDECPKDAWKSSGFCQELIKKNKLKDEDELQSFFIKRMEKFINSKGRSIIGWDEILEGGVAPNATVMSWRGTKGGIEAAKQKHNVIMTPTTYCYLDYYQAEPSKEPLAIGGYLPIEEVYNYDPMPLDLSTDEQKYILGVQGNLWTEYIPTASQVEYMAFPRLTALAETGWVPSGPKNFEDFALRLKAHLKRLDFWGVNASKRILDIRATTQMNTEGKLQVRLEKSDSDSKLFYTTKVKGDLSDVAEYVMPITLDKTSTIDAVTSAGAKFSETFYIHRAKGKPYTFSPNPDNSFDPNKKILTDGQVAKTPKTRAGWVQSKGNFEVTIDLGNVQAVTKVSTNFLKLVMYNIYPPTSVEIQLSKDGESWKDAINQPVKYNIEGPWEIMPVVADFRTARARYVRLKAKNYGDAEIENVEGKGKPTTIAIDEIVVD